MKAILPKIKFKNFYEKWNIKKLQSIAPLRGGFAFKSEKFQNVGIPIVRISNIGFDGTVGGEFEYYSKLSPDEKFVLKGRSLLLAMSGATTGKIAMLDSEEEYYQNQRVGYFQNNGAVDFDFLSSVLQTKAFTNQLNAVLVAGAQPNISSKEIDSFEFCIPESIEEQSAIGSLFRTLDDLLASYKDNLANYQSLKATMLSKIFPKAGQTVPEIRLDGFEGDWRIVKLGDVLSELKSGLSRELSNDDIGLPVIRANNISDGNLNLERDIKYWFKEDPKGANTANYFVKENDILVNFINSEAKMGTAAIVSREPDRETIYTTNILKLTLKGDYYPYFIYLMTFVQSYQNYIKSITKPAVNQASFTTVDFKKYEFLCPAFQEQQAIGAYFSNLDNLITSHQEKISQLETLKKKLLQDMFI